MSQIVPTTGKPVIVSLTGLRFFAAMLVVLYHYTWLIPFPHAAMSFVRQGWAGVGVFFVLSGFVITYNYADWFARDVSSYWTFLRARFARVVPMHVIALMLATPISLYAMYLHGIPLSLNVVYSWLANLFLLEAYVPVQVYKVWNGPAWSISVEFFYYLTFPFIAAHLLARFRRARSLELLGLGVLWIAVLLIAPAYLVIPFIVSQLPTDLGVEVGYLLHRFPILRMGEFLLGSILALAYLRARESKEFCLMAALQRNRLAREMAIGCALGLFALIALTSQNAEYTPHTNMVYMISAVLLIGALASGPTLISRPLQHPLVVLLGNASYSLYMIHWIPLAVVAILVGARRAPAIDPFWGAIAGPDAPGTWVAVLLLAATVLGSIACYKLVEHPARQWLRPRVRQPGQLAVSDKNGEEAMIRTQALALGEQHQGGCVEGTTLLTSLDRN